MKIWAVGNGMPFLDVDRIERGVTVRIGNLDGTGYWCDMDTAGIDALIKELRALRPKAKKQYRMVYNQAPSTEWSDVRPDRYAPSYTVLGHIEEREVTL